jgi:hypothetical protein
MIVLARTWPDAIDGLALLLAIAIACLPIVGYVLMVIDIRAWMRALKGALVRVVFHFPEMPAWARYHTPYCFKALGLSLPCTESDVKIAYRQLAEQTHPDRGGDRQKFLQLQRHFENAVQFLKDHEPEFRTE